MNYSQIYAKLTKGLSLKVKDIFDRRFGVKKSFLPKNRKGRFADTETLESIGKSLGITRERVRQIEEAGFNYIRKNNKEILDNLFVKLDSYFSGNGGFKKEEVIMTDFGGQKNKPYILFLLTIRNQFFRECEKKDYYSFWSIEKNSVFEAKKVLNSITEYLKLQRILMSKEELFNNLSLKNGLPKNILFSALEISKRVQSDREGKIGLIDWPEIKPKGVRDKAFLVLKEAKKPLHFREIASLISKSSYNESGKSAHPQTVHNELIKDSKFVLVGRGTYALGEWGYFPGTIKDVIVKILKEKPHLGKQGDIIKEVLSQRLVAKNTVLINLNNKNYFQKDPDGRYFLREEA